MMDIAKIKEDHGGHYPKSHIINQLIAEGERLTALCDEYRGELEETAHMAGEWEKTAEKLLERAEKAESALTRARAEGMEESAIKVDELKATLEDLSMHSPHALEDNAYSRSAYEAELTAAAIRAAKGER